MKKRYKAFIAVLIAWTATLLTVYVPTSNWISTTFPLTINDHTLASFIASTGLASAFSIFLGVDTLKAKP